VIGARPRRAAHLWLALLAGLNLLLICPGHVHDGHATLPHITVLGELGEEAHADFAAPAPLAGSRAALLPPADPDAPFGAADVAPATAGAAAGSFLTASPPSCSRPLRPQTDLQPEHPPPRRVQS
jgi:hypothetical protein